MLKIYENLENKDLFDLRRDTNYFRKENLKLIVFTNAITITDLSNALQRGKYVTEYIITYHQGYNEDFCLDLCNYLLNKNIELKQLIELLFKDELPDDFKEIFKISTNDIKGYRVFTPFKEHMPIKAPKKWTLTHLWKAVLSGQITTGKKTMRLTDDYAFDNANNFGKCKLNLLSFIKDIIESPSGWWIKEEKRKEDTIILSVNCHHFDYNTLIFKEKN